MIGQIISHYRILEKLGSGGMGVVYKAEDTRLSRGVALKFLPEAFAADSGRMARFAREAKVLASLNHPNIASIHGLEESGATRALVMELVEGPTLAERIKQGPIPLDEALPIAKQIAEALEYAHEHGIIHRDLKPANVKVTPEGTVKVLDFGLAKALAEEATQEESQDSPTLSTAATRAGVLLGTVAYMSPEQARGKRVDRRADIWAFGGVLYEMLCGQRAFMGETTSDTLAATITRDPDWTSLPASTPPRIRELLRRCLQRDPRQRLQAIGDARIGLEEVLSGSGIAEPLPGVALAQSRWSRMRSMAIAAIVASFATGLAFWYLRSPPEGKPLAQFAITLPAGERLALDNWPAVAVSPDGTELVYVAGRGEAKRLYLRSMSRVEVTPLPNTQNASSPFFSPDGRWVGFFADQKLKKVSLHGGLPIALADVTTDRGGAWAPDDTIIFAPNVNSGLLRISAAGGPPQVLTSPDAAKGERTHRWPEILPGGKAMLFTIGSLDSPSHFLAAKIAVQSFDTAERKILPVTGTFPRYEFSGHLVFAQSGGLFAVRFDLKLLEAAGLPVAVLSEPAADPTTGAGHFSLSRAGSFVYAAGGLADRDLALAWVGRNGQVQPLPAPARTYESPRVSPDGKRVAVRVSSPEAGTSAIWVYDIPHGTLTRLTYEGNDYSPIWTPDGRRITYMSERNGAFAVYWKAADGSGMEEMLLGPQVNFQLPTSWSPAANFLAFTGFGANLGGDIWVLPLEGDRKPQPFVQTKFDEHGPRFSPDGHWIAYVSNESGRFEVYVRPFPGPGGKWQISTDGGNWPVWARNGRELFYLNGDNIMGVAVTLQPAFAASTPRLLVNTPIRIARGPWSNGVMDVSPDGQRFIVVKDPGEKTGSSELRVILNWSEELKRLAPAAKQP